MKRLLWLEKNVEESINEINKPFQIGLVTGQFSVKQDFAVHFVSCPEKNDDDDDDDKESKSIKSTDAKDFDPHWVVEHARQVNRMLPGGLCVIGLFLLADANALTALKSKIQKTLLVLFKQMEKNHFVSQSIAHQERYFISIDPLSKKLSCRSFDIKEQMFSFTPADFKYQSFIDSFCCVSTIENLSIHIPVPIKEEMISLEKKIFYSVQSEIMEIWNSYGTIDCKLIDESESLMNTKKIKKKNTKTKDEHGEHFEIILFRGPPNSMKNNDVEKQMTDIVVKFNGNISAKAFVHSKGTYGEALKYLKVDIIKSLLTRVELLCEEAQVNNIAQVEEWSLVSPTRVFSKFTPSSLMCFSDYVFKDENESDVVSRFKEILNIDVNPTNFECVEHSPSVTEVLTMLDIPNDKQSDVNSDIASELSTSCQEERGNKKMFIAGGLVAAIATMGYSFVRLLYSSTD